MFHTKFSTIAAPDFVIENLRLAFLSLVFSVGRTRSIGLGNITGFVGSDLFVFKYHGSGRVTPTLPDPRDVKM